MTGNDNTNSKSKNKFAKKKNVSNRAQLPANIVETPTDIDFRLKNIEDGLQAIIENNEKNVSPEFNALMDGYVNKANEAETIKVKLKHVTSLYEDLKAEYKTIKEMNKQSSSDMEATKEALRLSELDLHQLKKELQEFRDENEEKINNLEEEKGQLKEKIKSLVQMRDREAEENELLKSQLIEANHLQKQQAHENSIEIESHKRLIREHEKLIEELREQLDLKTREVEYKDALLNQLIRETTRDTPIQQQVPHHPQHPTRELVTAEADPRIYQPKQVKIKPAKVAIPTRTSIVDSYPEETDTDVDVGEAQGGKQEQNGSDQSNTEYPSARWGAFRK